jgi:hypothetical protein
MMMQDMFHTHQIRLMHGNGVPLAINSINGPVPRPPRNRNNKQNASQKTSPPKNVTQNGGGGGQRKAKPLETFVDQRFGFCLGKTLDPDVVRDIKNFCKECAKAFQEADDFAEHCLTEEHKFRVIYMKEKYALILSVVGSFKILFIPACRTLSPPRCHQKSLLGKSMESLLKAWRGARELQIWNCKFS